MSCQIKFWVVLISKLTVITNIVFQFTKWSLISFMVFTKEFKTSSQNFITSFLRNSILQPSTVLALFDCWYVLKTYYLLTFLDYENHFLTLFFSNEMTPWKWKFKVEKPWVKPICQMNITECFLKFYFTHKWPVFLKWKTDWMTCFSLIKCNKKNG